MYSTEKGCVFSIGNEIYETCRYNTSIVFIRWVVSVSLIFESPNNKCNNNIYNKSYENKNKNKNTENNNRSDIHKSKKTMSGTNNEIPSGNNNKECGIISVP